MSSNESSEKSHERGKSHDKISPPSIAKRRGTVRKEVKNDRQQKCAMG
jgi:hypothetical protein